LLLIAGGIGITPALSFLQQLSQEVAHPADVKIWLACKSAEESIFLGMVSEALGPEGASAQLKVSVRLFVSDAAGEAAPDSFTLPIQRNARMAISSLEAQREELTTVVEGRKVFLCGPPAFETAAVGLLDWLGGDVSGVTRESFEF